MVSEYFLGQMIGRALFALPFNILLAWVIALVFSFKDRTLKKAGFAGFIVTGVYYLLVTAGISIGDVFGSNTALSQFILRAVLQFLVPILSFQKIYGLRTKQATISGGVFGAITLLISLFFELMSFIGRLYQYY